MGLLTVRCAWVVQAALSGVPNWEDNVMTDGCWSLGGEDAAAQLILRDMGAGELGDTMMSRLHCGSCASLETTVSQGKPTQMSSLERGYGDRVSR